jgi:hypothetical protein
MLEGKQNEQLQSKVNYGLIWEAST